jgi:hypothetical protein
VNENKPNYGDPVLTELTDQLLIKFLLQIKTKTIGIGIIQIGIA